MWETSLPVTKILGSVLVGRMQSPKVLAATLTIVFVLGLLIGWLLP